MKRVIPVLALFALLPFATLAAPVDDQKPAVQKPDAKKAPASKEAPACCSKNPPKEGGAGGTPHDMHGGGHDGGMHDDGHHAAMHENMHGEAGPHGGHDHGM